MRLGILTSHPIQYQAPWFRALAKEVDLEVFFAHRQSAQEQAKAGFGVAFDWDVDLLSGYAHHFLKNVSANPDVSSFAGCDTPEIIEIINRQSTPHSALRTPRFDAFIVCGWYLKSYLQAVNACRAARVPVLVRGDSQLGTPRSRLKRLAMEVRQRWLLRKFDGFLSVGKRHREYLEHFGVPAEKIFFAPHFVDNEWFGQRAAEARSQRSEVRRRWGADEDDLVALFVGKFISKKRPLDLLKALVRVRNSSERGPLSPREPKASNSRTRLSALRAASAEGMLAVFVGSGELENELREFAVREKLRVHFAGFKNQSELPACYVAADVQVLPSDNETWGLVVNEGMACGLPVIVSDAVGCAPDLIEEAKTGFVFPLGDVEALAGCVEKLAELKSGGYSFAPNLKAKMETYNLAVAVAGTLRAVRELGAGRHASQ